MFDFYRLNKHALKMKDCIFTQVATDYVYHRQRFNTLNGIDDACLPLEVDTEYYQPKYHPGTVEPLNTTITNQIRSPFVAEGKIYAHPNIRAIARHPVTTAPCVGIDYLVDLGHAIEVYRCSWDDSIQGMPVLYLDLYTFFAVAELYRIFQGNYLKDINHLCTFESNKGIEQSRRLRTYTHVGGQYYDYVIMPWQWIIDGFRYRIALRIIDTSAVHGNTNYATFCKNSNVKLKYKDIFNSTDKSNMLNKYIETPEEFDRYALGDLHNHEALMGNAESFKKIYDSLGLSNYFTPPRLTIGSTVSRIIESGLKNVLKSDSEDNTELRKYCSYACAENIKRLGTTGALNAKVDGGRCRNNRPIHTYAEGVLCDIDISGCYGEGLRSQEYPLGIPVIIDYPMRTDRNEYVTLREFRRKYERELVPGLWQARVSTKTGYTLKYKQDMLISWMPPKDITKLTTDSEFAETDEWWTIDNTGETKIFQNEVHNAIITHDFLQWLDNVSTTRQRKELLDELLIITAMYYPASKRVNSVDTLRKMHLDHKGKNTTNVRDVKGKTTKIKIEQECHAWYAINLGDLIVNKLLLERKKYEKKTPFNELYKLCVNTVYGDMVSPYFKIGNVVVGNNITARARAMAWYMEKGLFGWQSITDGCVFNVNRVAYPREGRQLSGENTVDLYYQKSGDTTVLLQPLQPSELNVTVNSYTHELRSVYGEPAITSVSEGKLIELTPKESLDWINQATFNHLRNLFPNVDILHKPTTNVKDIERIGQFEFESKGLYESATFHGTANYSLRWNGEDKIAMRSYSKKSHTILAMNDVVEIVDTDGMPAKTFLLGLRLPTNLERSHVYIKSRILKVGDYRRHYTKWMVTKIVPGMNIETAALLREFSLSQFTYKTLAQYRGWKLEYEKLLRQYGQSYEMMFLNSDGSLNYQWMVESIDEAIREGKKGFFDGVEKRKHNCYRMQLPHAEEMCLKKVTDELNLKYLGGLPGSEGIVPDIYYGKSEE